MITLYYRRSSLHLPQEAKSLMALGTTDGCFCVMIYSSVHFFNYLRPSEKTFLRTWILNLELDFLIKALVLCSLLEEELAEVLCAPVPSSSFPAGDLAIDHLHHVVSGLNTALIICSMNSTNSPLPLHLAGPTFRPPTFSKALMSTPLILSHLFLVQGEPSLLTVARAPSSLSITSSICSIEWKAFITFAEPNSSFVEIQSGIWVRTAAVDWWAGSLK